MRKIINLLIFNKNKKNNKCDISIIGAALYYTKEELNKLREDALKNSECFIWYKGKKVFFNDAYFDFFTYNEMKLLYEKSLIISYKNEKISYLLFCINLVKDKEYYIEFDCCGNYLTFFIYKISYKVLIKAVSKKYLIGLIANIKEKEEVSYINI